MNVTDANRWARDLAWYVRRHPPQPPVDLRRRIRHMTAGEGLDENDVAQLERKVRWLLFGRPRVKAKRKEQRILVDGKPVRQCREWPACACGRGGPDRCYPQKAASR